MWGILLSIWVSFKNYQCESNMINQYVIWFINVILFSNKMWFMNVNVAINEDAQRCHVVQL